jgi:hypothetical protein
MGSAHPRSEIMVTIQQGPSSGNRVFIRPDFFVCGDSGGECRRMPDTADMINLREGVSVSAVLFGDSNNDGHTDIILQLSNGAGYLFQLRPLFPVYGAPFL